MAHAFSRLPLTAEVRVRFQCSPCVGQSDTGAFVLPVLEVSPVRLMKPLLHTRLNVQTDKGAKPGKPPNSDALSGSIGLQSNTRLFLVYTYLLHDAESFLRS